MDANWRRGIYWLWFAVSINFWCWEIIMASSLQTKCTTCAIAASLLFLTCPDKRSSEQIKGDVIAEEMSMHFEYNPDDMHYYYDSQM